MGWRLSLVRTDLLLVNLSVIRIRSLGTVMFVADTAVPGTWKTGLPWAQKMYFQILFLISSWPSQARRFLYACKPSSVLNRDH